MSKWKISIYFAVLFLAGVVTGAFATHQVIRAMMSKATRPAAMAGRWEADLQNRLQITPDQSQQIRAIIHDTISTFSSNFEAQMLLQLSNANVRIAVELTPEQRIKFAEMEKEQVNFIQNRFRQAGEPPKKP